VSFRHESIEYALREIEKVEGTIDSIKRSKHIMVFWTTRDGRKAIQTLPFSSRSISGLKNLTSRIRRQARTS
jgi:hypothetical protein